MNIAKKILRTVLLVGVTTKLVQFIQKKVLNKRWKKLLTIIVLLGAIVYNRQIIWEKGIVRAAQLFVPNAFSPGEVISSSEMNENFAAVEASVNRIEGENIVDGSITTDKLATLSINAGQIANDAIFASKLADDVDGAGLGQHGFGEVGYSEGALKVNVDGTTVEINADNLRVKDGGITAAKIADGAITATSIADGTITNTSISATAAIAASKINFDTDITGTGLCSLWAYRITAPTINTITVPTTWTDYDCDTDFASIPTGPCLAIVWCQVYSVSGTCTLHFRPNGYTTWTTTAPYLSISSIQGQNAMFLVATDSGHIFEYWYETTSPTNNGKFSVIGYIPVQPQ